MFSVDRLDRLSDAQTRSISAENPTGAPGMGGRATEGTGAAAARDLGPGCKVSPSIRIAPGETATLAEVEGPGTVQHIWLTARGVLRHAILRIFWDGQEQPSVECPLGDFFACGWGRHAQISSLAVCVNPALGFNAYWPMPFRRRCRITLANIADTEMTLYYQITYGLGDVPADAAYFHAQFRRVNPVPYGEVVTLLDGVQGRGQYVGTAMAWGVNNDGWWGEGEIKFYLDDDDAYPTICGTGTEDYFGGAWCFIDNVWDARERSGYLEFTTPYSGMPQVLRPDGALKAQTRFTLYRWHITDPVRFRRRLRVTMQALGWRAGRRYLPLQDDIASVAYWYQALPTAPFPPLPDRDSLEII